MSSIRTFTLLCSVAALAACGQLTGAKTGDSTTTTTTTTTSAAPPADATGAKPGEPAGAAPDASAGAKPGEPAQTPVGAEPAKP